MTSSSNRKILWLLNNISVGLFILVFLTFGLLSDKFLTTANFTNLLLQASSTAVLATGMTFVLLTAGVDLSVGAIMFVAGGVAGKLIGGGASFGIAITAILMAGMAAGALNAALVTWLKIIPFVATLGTLYIGRGLGLWVTETRAMNLPEDWLHLGSGRILGIPGPIWICAVVLIVAHLVLKRTPFGRQIYALGYNKETAVKAGVNAKTILWCVYLISGGLAGVAAIISLTQLGAISPTFGTNREFTAISAAVLGGTSLFGGRGAVLPGTLLGALLIQTIESGLVMLNTDPYLYPLITSAVIFVAVLLDSVRTRLLEKWTKRVIYQVG